MHRHLDLDAQLSVGETDVSAGQGGPAGSVPGRGLGPGGERLLGGRAVRQVTAVPDDPLDPYAVRLAHPPHGAGLQGLGRVPCRVRLLHRGQDLVRRPRLGVEGVGLPVRAPVPAGLELGHRGAHGHGRVEEPDARPVGAVVVDQERRVVHLDAVGGGGRRGRLVVDPGEGVPVAVPDQVLDPQVEGPAGRAPRDVRRGVQAALVVGGAEGGELPRLDLALDPHAAVLADPVVGVRAGLGDLAGASGVVVRLLGGVGRVVRRPVLGEHRPGPRRPGPVVGQLPDVHRRRGSGPADHLERAVGLLRPGHPLRAGALRAQRRYQVAVQAVRPAVQGAAQHVLAEPGPGRPLAVRRRAALPAEGRVDHSAELPQVPDGRRGVGQRLGRAAVGVVHVQPGPAERVDVATRHDPGLLVDGPAPGLRLPVLVGQAERMADLVGDHPRLGRQTPLAQVLPGRLLHDGDGVVGGARVGDELDLDPQQVAAGQPLPEVVDLLDAFPAPLPKGLQGRGGLRIRGIQCRVEVQVDPDGQHRLGVPVGQPDPTGVEGLPPPVGRGAGERVLGRPDLLRGDEHHLRLVHRGGRLRAQLLVRLAPDVGDDAALHPDVEPHPGELAAVDLGGGAVRHGLAHDLGRARAQHVPGGDAGFGIVPLRGQAAAGVAPGRVRERGPRAARAGLGDVDLGHPRRLAGLGPHHEVEIVLARRLPELLRQHVPQRRFHPRRDRDRDRVGARRLGELHAYVEQLTVVGTRLLAGGELGCERPHLLPHRLLLGVRHAGGRLQVHPDGELEALLPGVEPHPLKAHLVVPEELRPGPPAGHGRLVPGLVGGGRNGDVGERAVVQQPALRVEDRLDPDVPGPADHPDQAVRPPVGLVAVHHLDDPPRDRVGAPALRVVHPLRRARRALPGARERGDRRRRVHPRLQLPAVVVAHDPVGVGQRPRAGAARRTVGAQRRSGRTVGVHVVLPAGEVDRVRRRQVVLDGRCGCCSVSSFDWV